MDCVMSKVEGCIKFNCMHEDCGWWDEKENECRREEVVAKQKKEREKGK